MARKTTEINASPTATGGLLERLEHRTARIVVLGQGYVGLPLAMAVTEAGFPVIGLEVDEERAARARRGVSYVDDVSATVLQAAFERGYRITSDPDELAGFDVAVISVPTPLTDGLPDLSHIEAATLMVGARLRPGCLVVLESTTYPGTTQELVAPRLEAASGLVAGIDFCLGYSPERIDPGNATFSLANTPKVVSGISPASLRAVEAFYACFVEKLVPVDSPAEAELAKLIENTFRLVNIALINELATFADKLDINIWRAIEAAATKPFGYMPFWPGPGVGGHCLAVDPSYLSWRVRRRLGEAFRFVELANDINAHMPGYVVRRVKAQLNDAGLAVNGARILALGVAYKPGTGDARESPALEVVDGLMALGAVVRVADPHVPAYRLPQGVPRVECTPEEVRGADLVLILTDHPEFDFEMVARHARRVFDTRNRMASTGIADVDLL